MQHKPSNPNFEIMRALGDFALANKIPLNDPRLADAFNNYVSDLVARELKSPLRPQGMRTQEMFAYVAASLGKCEAVSEEDSGEMLSQGASIQRPDYRLFTKGHGQVLVEVKNHYQKRDDEPFEIKKEYVASLQAYADLCSLPLMIAIRWSRSNRWTLIPPGRFQVKGKTMRLAFIDAFRFNEMSAILGDSMIGIEPPFSFRVYTDPKHPRRVEADGRTTVVVDRMSLCAGGVEVVDPLEKSLAAYFMFYGHWSQSENVAEVINGDAVHVEVQFGGDPIYRDQGFEIIGTLSSMASNKFCEETSNDDKIGAYRILSLPGTLLPHIPDDYRSNVLKLWTFGTQAMAK